MQEEAVIRLSMQLDSSFGFVAVNSLATVVAPTVVEQRMMYLTGQPPV
jgi:hypothetical protein